MGNIHDIFRDEEVKGEIVGGPSMRGGLYYDGRLQYGVVYGNSDDDLVCQLKNKLEWIKEDCGVVFSSIYPSDLWEVKIID